MMFESSKSQSAKEYVLRLLRKVAPGQCMVISRNAMRDISGMDYNGERWNAADRVLESIVGSSYEWSYEIDHMSGAVCFSRRLERLNGEDGSRTYVSPDRRYLYTHDIVTQLYILKR